MSWFKKNLDENMIQGHEVYVNPKPTSERSLNRTVERIKRIKLTLEKIQDRESDRYRSFMNELNRLETSLIEYEFRKRREGR